jgi:hypothetical protein
MNPSLDIFFSRVTGERVGWREASAVTDTLGGELVTVTECKSALPRLVDNNAARYKSRGEDNVNPKRHRILHSINGHGDEA